MTDLQGTQSQKNLEAALKGESLARNKYTFYAQQARAEGNTEVAELFEKMARNETAHAMLWFKMLYGEFKSSEQNLQEAASGEYGEWRSMYPEFARQAREEGLPELASMFEKVAAIEQDHESQFLMAYASLFGKQKSKAGQTGEVEQETETRPAYRCLFCGAVYDERPDVCGVCGAIGSFDSCTVKKR